MLQSHHRELDASAENELLKKLLVLSRAAAPALEVGAALRMLVEMMGATTAYFELVSDDEATVWFSAGYDLEGNEPRDVVSRGVLARAITDGAMIVTPSARNDPRFRDLSSVRRERLEAVACAPIELSELSGALCIQRSFRCGAFSADHLRLVELFAQQLAQVARRLGIRDRTKPVPMRDEVRRFQEALVREALARSNGNVAQAARDLKVARSFVYTLAPWAVRS